MSTLTLIPSNNIKTSLFTFVHSRWGFHHLLPYAKELHLLAEVLPSLLQFIKEVAVILVQNALKLVHYLWNIQYINRHLNAWLRKMKLVYKTLFCVVPWCLELCTVNDLHIQYPWNKDMPLKPSQVCPPREQYRNQWMLFWLQIPNPGAERLTRSLDIFFYTNSVGSCGALPWLLDCLNCQCLQAC